MGGGQKLDWRDQRYILRTTTYTYGHSTYNVVEFFEVAACKSDNGVLGRKYNPLEEELGGFIIADDIAG